MKILHFKNYLNVIKKVPETKIFQNIFVEENGRVQDILKNGDISCAYFVSSILYLFKCIKDIHATVNGIENELQIPEWKKISLKSIKEGDVIIWEKALGKNKAIHRHIGFYIGNSYAISNNDTKLTPIKHHFTFKNTRRIEAVYHYRNW